jgi:hypothetical protein
MNHCGYGSYESYNKRLRRQQIIKKKGDMYGHILIGILA